MSRLKILQEMKEQIDSNGSYQSVIMSLPIQIRRGQIYHGRRRLSFPYGLGDGNYSLQLSYGRNSLGIDIWNKDERRLVTPDRLAYPFLQPFSTDSRYPILGFMNRVYRADPSVFEITKIHGSSPMYGLN